MRACSPPSGARASAAEPFAAVALGRFRAWLRRGSMPPAIILKEHAMTFNPTRRSIAGGLAASAGLAATGLGAISPFSSAFAQAYPGRKVSVVIPTGQGGGAERLARAFDDSWGKILKTQFEYQFFP